MKKINLNSTQAEASNFLSTEVLPIPVTGENSWVIVVARATDQKDIGRMEVELRRFKEQRTGFVTSVAQTMGQFGLVVIPYPLDTSEPLYAAIDAGKKNIHFQVFVVNEHSKKEVDIPLNMLGSDLVNELDLVNHELSHIVASILEDPETLPSTPMLAKIYICGLNKKNKTSKPCTILNIVICGRKKDRNVKDSIKIDEQQKMHQAVDADELPGSAINMEPYIDLISDGGCIWSEGEDERINRFNNLAKVTRSLVVYYQESDPAME